MLVGEPGIGKTALCEQLCEFAGESGGHSLVGHCYEEGSFRPPYQPFVEIFSMYLQGSDPEAVSSVLDSNIVELARIIPTAPVAAGDSSPPGRRRCTRAIHLPHQDIAFAHQLADIAAPRSSRHWAAGHAFRQGV
jgi:hypothetical protein